MDFGKVTQQELEHIDFTLPPDTPQTQAVLSASAHTDSTRFYVGCAKWGRPDWVGKIYPPKTKPADFLRVYASRFNAIELNAVYYQLPTAEGMRRWKEMTPEGFLFCPKFSDVITHRKRLRDIDAELDHYLSAMMELGSRLGPFFLMPHPQMGPKHVETIAHFVRNFPKDLDLFVEYRHPQWYEKQYHHSAFDYLLEAAVGTVITDAAGRRDVVHMNLTTPDAFIRFVGNSLHDSDYKRIDEWVERIRQWSAKGLRNCYFFMHQHDELYSPELCRYLIEQLNLHCNAQLQLPHFYNDSQLF